MINKETTKGSFQEENRNECCSLPPGFFGITAMTNSAATNALRHSNGVRTEMSGTSRFQTETSV